MTAAETERSMLDRLNRKYSTFNGNGFRYSRAEHVRVTAGFDARRVCDYMALDLWPGGLGPDRKGPLLHGHEVKVSRSDWLTELRDPEKAEAFARYCDYWWLVVGDSGIVRDGELPAGWGLLVASGDSLRTVRRATRRREVEPMGRDLQATFSRSVTKTTVRLAGSEDGAIRLVRQRMGLL
ncbi:hypothetical protein PBI_COTE_65 [Arthrobacter phage Cote]|uniref:Uncharacterized protein n=1 Tax=Arthrobacter phage Cote TaxID=2419953 RepID=A0A3G2KF78_9CAUD|nr:hypothetical protein PBI_COTE_65 [Arthrobacter phage Cote]